MAGARQVKHRAVRLSKVVLQPFPVICYRKACHGSLCMISVCGEIKFSCEGYLQYTPQAWFEVTAAGVL